MMTPSDATLPPCRPDDDGVAVHARPLRVSSSAAQRAHGHGLAACSTRPRHAQPQPQHACMHALLHAAAVSWLQHKRAALHAAPRSPFQICECVAVPTAPTCSLHVHARHLPPHCCFHCFHCTSWHSCGSTTEAIHPALSVGRCARALPLQHTTLWPPPCPLPIPSQFESKPAATRTTCAGGSCSSCWPTSPLCASPPSWHSSTGTSSGVRLFISISRKGTVGRPAGRPRSS